MDRLDGCPRWLKPVMALVYLLKGLMQLLNYFNNEPRRGPVHDYYIVCKCGKNHALSANKDGRVGTYSFVCGEWGCSPVSKELLGLSDKSSVQSTPEFTNKELELLKTIRDLYTKPPDKNIVAVCMFSIFIKAFKMPTIFENHLELYDEPVNR